MLLAVVFYEDFIYEECGSITGNDADFFAP
jgi:hypothetical protein